jgi:hypothetical protein
MTTTCPMDGTPLIEQGRRSLGCGERCYVADLLCDDGDEVAAKYHFLPCKIAKADKGTARLSITFEDEESQVAARDALIKAFEDRGVSDA